MAGVYKLRARHVRLTVGFTLTFLLVASSSQAKMCPKRLPEPANAGPEAGGRSDLWSGVAERTTNEAVVRAAGHTCCLK